MSISGFQRLLGRSRLWCGRLLFAWQASDKGSLGFAVMLLLPLTALASLIRFANVDGAERQAAEARQRDLRCLAENIYYEARGEPVAGQHAVAEVTMNRVAADEFPSSVCEVVHEKRLDAVRRRYVGAFSWTEIESLPRPRGAAWQRAIEAAGAVYDGRAPAVVPEALFYHSTAIEPRWAGEKEVLATIGRHVFYR